MALPQFGADINLSTGDLTYDGKGAPQYTTGIDTLAQALYRRLICPPGRLLLHPEYGGGFMSYINQPMSQTNIANIATAARTQVMQDLRVQSVQSCVVTPYSPSSSSPGFMVQISLLTTASPDLVNLSIPIQASS